MRNIRYFNLFPFPRFILLYREYFLQGKSYEIKQDALREECGSIPRLLFLRRDSFKFFLEDKEDFLSEVLNLLRPSREFCGRVYCREDFLHVLSLESFLTVSPVSFIEQGKFLVTLGANRVECDSTS